jgi:hypothetical protein
MNIGSYNRRQHLSRDFAMGVNAGTGFWLLINASGKGGMIGASPHEAQAVHDACLSIEE